MPYIYNGQPITGAIRIGDINYPWNWDFALNPVDGVIWQEPEPVPEPTPQENVDSVRMQARMHILATYPDWFQANVALGIYGQPIADKLRDDIAAVIVESNRCEQLAFDGQPFTINFPIIGV